MTTATPPQAFPEIALRYQSELLGRMPEYVARLAWDREQIEAHQLHGLRRLLAHAQAHSPFHARRLGGIDTERFQLADLLSLPVMTKAEMMANFDEAVTDRSLTRAKAEQVIATTGETPHCLAGEYYCIASGGSSGTRGVFVLSWEALLDLNLAVVRPSFARMLAAGGPPPQGLVLGMVAAPAAVHATRLGGALMDGPAIRVAHAPSTLPLEEIVARLNAAQPHLLVGYPGVMRLLAREQSAGRLQIHPNTIMTASEQLTAEAGTAIGAAFGVPVVNSFGSSEGLIGASDPGGDVITFASDLAIVELVDERDQPVPPGTPSAKVLVTNLSNLAQPLIRYELSDSFVEQPAAAHGHFRAIVAGRSDEAFTYDGARIQPIVIRSALVKVPEITEFQARQTPRGMDIDLVADRPLDTALVAALLTRALEAAGLRDPEVHLRVVPALERQAQTGKLRRFIPLPAR